MKATAPTPTLTAEHEQAAEKAGWGDFADLMKARLNLLVLVTAAVGFYAGWQGAWTGEAILLLIHALFGTALVAAGAAALNQLLEREWDARMHRTENRPLPAGRLQPGTVLVLGGVTSGTGLIYLAFTTNLLTAFLAAVTLVSYLFVYTPLKRITPLNTVVGAVPGALPPLMGWTAARGEVTVEGWSLFAILFFWQLPHFFAIAWLYREDYARAGFKMLPVVDPAGERIGPLTVSHTLGLLPVSLAPFLFQLAGVYYLTGALVLTLGFIWLAVRFSRELSETRARHLFYGSIVYLPVLLGLIVFDKWK